MASALAGDPINQLEENLQCTVCLEVLTDPRTLPCCHSFCKVCLERIVESCRDKAPRGQPIREFPCPNCRAMFVLDPDKHVADMPRNHFICNMVKVAAVLDRGIGVPCSHNCNQSYSVARCVTCEKFLCRECLTAHNNYRGNNSHSVLTMEKLSKLENRKKINNKIYCNEHSSMELKVYCKTCDQLICRDCMDFKHVKDHSFVLVKDEANKYKERLALNNAVMENALTEGNLFLQQLTLTTQQLDRNAENAKNTIALRKEFVVKKVLEMLDQKAESLCKEVDEIHKSKRASLGGQTEKTKLYVENIKTSVQLSKKLVDQGTEEEIISSQKIMLDNAKNLLTNREKFFKAPIPDSKLGYTLSTGKEPLNEKILKQLTNNLGEVNVGNEVMLSMTSMTASYATERAGGGEVKDGRIYLNLEERIALVEFENPNVKQTLDNSTLSVERYYPILRNLADLNSTEPKSTKPGTSEPTRCVAVPKPRRRKATVLMADIDLDLYRYLKDHHPAQWSFALKEPQPDIELKNESVSFTFSTRGAKEHFLNEIKDYKSEIVPINPALLKQGLSEKLNEIISVFSSSKSISFIERYNEGFIKLVGRAVPTFDLAINKVKECIAEIEEKTN